MNESRVPDALRDHLVPIDSVKPWPDNPRRGDTGALAESLHANGQYRPAVVQAATGRICAGNHMWLAAKNLGWSHIAAIHVDLTDEEAKRILVADNRIGELGGYDERLLAGVLGELATTDLALEGTGYDQDALEDLVAMVEAPADLNSLEQRYGPWEPTPAPGDTASGSGETPQWTVISIACPPDVKARFDQVFNALPGQPHERLAAILQKAGA